MTTVYKCRTSGASINQFKHFGQFIYYKQYFGDYDRNMVFPLPLTPRFLDYPLSQITANISIHKALDDVASNPVDLATLESKIPGRIKCTHIVSAPDFTHEDFAVGITAYKLVYEPIVDFWEQGKCANEN